MTSAIISYRHIASLLQDLKRMKAEVGVIRTTLNNIFRFPLIAPPPHSDSCSPALRIGLGGDIPIVPPLFMVLSILGGFGVSACLRMPGNFIKPMLAPPSSSSSSASASSSFSSLYIAARVLLAACTLKLTATIKQQCDRELRKAGTEAAFKPVPSVATNGPYAWCRNPMYVASLGGGRPCWDLPLIMHW